MFGCKHRKKSDPVYFDFTFLIKNVPSMSPRPPPPLLLLLSQSPDGSRGLSTAAVSRKKCCIFHRFSFCPSGHCHPTTRRSFNFLLGVVLLGEAVGAWSGTTFSLFSWLGTSMAAQATKMLSSKNYKALLCNAILPIIFLYNAMRFPTGKIAYCKKEVFPKLGQCWAPIPFICLIPAKDPLRD